MPAWCLPAELQTPVPRPARITPQAKLVSAVGFLFFGGLGILLLSFLVPKVETRAALKWHGVDTGGQITQLFVERSRHGPIYRVAYRYTPPVAATVPHPWDTGERLGVGEVASWDYRGLRLGMPLPVIYDPRDPARSLPNLRDAVRTGSPVSGLEMPILFEGLLLAGCLVVVVFFGRCWRNRNLLTFGAAARATILGEEEYTTKNQSFSKVTYQFVDACGTTVRGVRKSLPPGIASSGEDLLFRMRVFDNPTVLYDPRNSAHNLLYPPFFAEIVNRS